MRYIFVSAIFCFAMMHSARAETGILVEIAGVDVSGTTEDVFYVVGSRQALLASIPVNTTVAYGPYAYTGVFYLPHNVPLSALVVTNQAGTKQTTFGVQQVTPVGAIVAAAGTGPAAAGDIGGRLFNINSSDVSGTTEYVWANVGGSYSLLGSGLVNTVNAYGPFAYNILFYLPATIPVANLFVTNQAGTVQTGFTRTENNPLGTAAATDPPAGARALKQESQSAGRSGQLVRAQGRDVSGTTEYVWHRQGRNIYAAWCRASRCSRVGEALQLQCAVFATQRRLRPQHRGDQPGRNIPAWHRPRG